MPLEQGIYGMLVGGFCIVMGVAVILTMLLWIRCKSNHYGFLWTLFHFILFSVAIYFFLKAVSIDYNHPMASEEISFQIGIAGVVWAISIVCLLLAVYNFVKREGI